MSDTGVPQPAPAPQPGRHAPDTAHGSNGLATAGFVLGLLGLLISWIPLLNILGMLLAVTGVVLAAIGLAKSKKANAGKGLAVAGLVLGVLAVIIAVLVNVVFVGAVDKAIDETLGETTDTSIEGATEDSGEATPKPTCAYIGTGDRLDGMQVDLRFTNPLGEVHGLEVTYALLGGKGGTRFFTGTAGGIDRVDIKFPTANEQFRFLVETGEDLPPSIDATTISCKVLAIEESTDIGGYKRSSGNDTCEVIGTDSSGRVEVQLAVTNPYGETARVQTWWALRAPGPVTFQTDTEVVDLVAAGETFKITPQYGADKPEWIDDDEVTCAVLGFWNQTR